VNDLKLIIRRVGEYAGDVMLHLGGEPLLDQEMPKKISLLRRVWPRAHLFFVSTLGVPVNEDYLDALWRSGLNLIEVSFYGYDPATYRQVHGVDRFELAWKNLQYLLTSPVRREHTGQLRLRNLHLEMHDDFKDAAYQERANTFRRELNSYDNVLISDTYLMSQSGQSCIKRERATLLPCSITWGKFAHHLVITWDLNVVVCGHDFDNHLVFGNLKNASIKQIFSGKVYKDFISAMWSDNLSAYPLCDNCEREVLGSQDELLRINAWKVMFLFEKLTQEGVKPIFTIIGEPALAEPLSDLFAGSSLHYREPDFMVKTIAKSYVQAVVFIAARDEAQLHYYIAARNRFHTTVEGPTVRIIPITGISYQRHPGVANKMAKLYRDSSFQNF
jgi:hypothetical protein